MAIQGGPEGFDLGGTEARVILRTTYYSYSEGSSEVGIESQEQTAVAPVITLY